MWPIYLGRRRREKPLHILFMDSDNYGGLRFWYYLQVEEETKT